MADLAQLERALINADAAGDSDAARVFAAEIQKMRQPAAQPNDPLANWNPTDEMSGLDKFRAGMGKAFADIGRGAGQMVGLVSRDDVDESNRLDQKLMNTGAGVAGNITGNVASIIPAAMIPGVNTMAGATALGTIYGALQPVGTEDSRTQNALLGGGLGMLGQGAANVIGRVARPVRATLEPQVAGLAQKAKKAGIDLNAAQLTGSKPLRWIDSALDNLPFTAEKQAAAKQAQKEAWQKAVLNQTGETATSPTAKVMGRAKDRIGKAFNDLSARNTVTLDPNAEMQLSTIAAQNRQAGPLSSGKVDDVIAWLKDQMKPVNSPVLGPNGAPFTSPASPIPGAQYQDIRSILTRKASDAFSSGDSQLGQALKGIRAALDDAAERSISKKDAAAWKTARDQWKTLKAIEKATDPTTGTISPKKLVNELTRKNPQGMIYGKGDQTMPDLAKVGKQFIAENLPDSGTAQRSWYMNMLQNPTAGIGGLLGFAGGGAPGAMAGAALGAGTPLAAQRALWSQGGRQYFSQGIQPLQNAMPYINVAAESLPVGLLNSQ